MGSLTAQARNFTYTWFDGTRNIDLAAEEVPDDVAQAVRELEDRFDPDSCACHGGLVILARTWDNRDALLSLRIQELGISGGYAFDEVLTCKAGGMTWRAGEPLEIRLVAPGYATFSRKLVAHLNEIVIWNDVVLQRPTPSTSGDLFVRVLLEGGAVAKEAPVFLDQAALGFTDDLGEFRLPLAPIGKHGVSARVDGFVGLWQDRALEPGKRTVCELTGFRVRSALVRWAYQPNGSRRFDETAKTGWAIVAPGTLSRVSFTGGFANVPGTNDFVVRQTGTHLFMDHFDQLGYRGRGSIAITDREFDAVVEAPEAGYSSNGRLFSGGSIFVFLTTEGKSYGKLEVVDVVDTPDDLEQLKADYKVELAIP